MRKILRELSDFKKYYARLANRASLQLRKLPSEGKIRAINTKNGPRYYLLTKRGQTIGKYLKKKDISLAQQIIQRDYLKKIVELNRKWVQTIENFLNKIPDEYPDQQFSFTSARNALIQPLADTTEQFVTDWLSQKYDGKPFSEDSRKFYADCGITVRSKTEKIIADKLSSMKIPYKYEFPVEMKTETGNLKTFYPDFTILNKRTRQSVILEHFGLMEDSDYQQNAFAKIQLYHKNGWYLGKNFLFTFETEHSQFDSRILEKQLYSLLELG